MVGTSGRRVEQQPAYVLSQRPYRETSLLVEAFTLRHGRIGLVARGARGSKAKNRGVIQPFTPLLLSWLDSGELGTLTAAESVGAAFALPGERIFHAWYLNELLLNLLQRHDVHQALFAVYGDTLPKLTADSRPDTALRSFELRLLADIGYGLEFPPGLAVSRRYGLDAAGERWRAVADAHPGSYAGATLLAMRDDDFAALDAEGRKEARQLLQAALRRQLGGKILKTPAMLRAIRTAASSPREIVHD